MIVQVSLRSQHQYIGLYAHALQLLHAVLCRLGLQLVGSFQIGHVGKMHAHRIPTQLPAQLTYSLHKRCALYIADGSAHLGYHEVQALVQSLA